MHQRMECSGHSGSVESVCVMPGSSKFASGGWDSRVLIWDANATTEERPAKKMRVESAVETLSGHTQCVSALAWPDPLALYSGSHDHSLRLWSVTVGENTRTWSTGAVVTDIAFHLGSNRIATAHCDNAVCLLGVCVRVCVHV